MANRHKKSKKIQLETVFKSGYAKVAQELIVELSAPIPPGICEYNIIKLASEAVRSTEVKFCHARRTMRGNNILHTHPNISTSAVEAYTTAISPSFQEQGLITNTIRASSHWSKFLLHGVPTFQCDDLSTSKQVAEEN